MVEKMEANIVKRERIQQELQRVATRTTKMFFRTPLMIKNIIQLIIEKSVDIKDIRSSSEVNLMIAMKNLYFHTDQNTSFTELDSPEDQEYLLMCMKLCQQKIQLSDEGDNINTVRGIQSMWRGRTIASNTKFQEKSSKFLLILSRNFLDVVHLSYMEFFCAASLCREGTDIEEELCKFKDEERLHAVVTYIAGLLSLNPYSLSITQVTARESLRTFCVFWATTSGRLPSRRFLWTKDKWSWATVSWDNSHRIRNCETQRFTDQKLSSPIFTCPVPSVPHRWHQHLCQYI